MKISPITYSFILPKQSIQKNTTNPVVRTQTTNIQQLSNIYYQPINFTAKEKRTFQTDKPRLKEHSGDFQICKFNDVHCPACGKKMMNRNKFEKFCDDLANVPQDKYLEFLGEYEPYMRPVESSVYKELLVESKKEGTTDIRELLVSLRDHKLPVLQEAQMKLVNKMVSLARTLPDDEQRALMSKINQLKAEIRRKNEKLQRIAKNFPTSSDMNSAWIVKYSGKNKFNEDWDSYSIATRFLQSSVANTDHILAYDIDNTHDDISNYMAMHNACNGQKGNKPFLQWLNEDKTNRIKYMQEYFDDCDELISTKRLRKKKYRNYVAYATQTVFEVSKGQVRIEPTKRPIENIYPIDPKTMIDAEFEPYEDEENSPTQN